MELNASDAPARVAAADSAFATGAPLRHQAAFLLAVADLYLRIGDEEAALNRYRREWVVWGEEPAQMLPARRLGRPPSWAFVRKPSVCTSSIWP